MTDILLILIKNPRLGVVKTRLAHTVGDAEALRIYSLLLEKTRQAALNVPVERWLFYSDRVEPDDEWPATDFHKMLQSGDNLGSRMEDGFNRAFAAGAGRVVLIGSDCPELSGRLLAAAFDGLDTHDFVLGPALDGGYYLLGMKSPTPELFQGIAWSTDTVRQHTLEKIRAAGKTCFLLPVYSDIDTEADWRAYCQRVLPPDQR